MSNKFNNEIEQFANKDEELKKLGLYPKNQQTLLKAVSEEEVWRLWKFSVFCDINDIEFLFRNTSSIISVVIMRYAILSFEDMVSLIQTHPELQENDFNMGHMIRRTYEAIYYFRKNSPSPIIFVYSRPKNPKEREFYNKICKSGQPVKIVGHRKDNANIIYDYLTLL